ncbi:hypothetical protein [Klebsiella pneumoniae]|uniref:hypothetical protein n=1 Tax=Klebsiella pneumoniae TaxID=573 RepID=UPI0021B099B1|nr:hypothetical protein [Klebsiella pneumoniae]
MGQLAVQEYYGLAGAFLVIGLFFGLAELWAGRMRFVGLSHKERREYADRYKRDNKRPAPFSVLASLDSPGGWSGHVDMSGTTRTG